MLFLGIIIFTYILNPCNLAPSNQSCNTTVYYTTYLGESASPHLDLQDPHHRWIAILFLYSAIHRMSIALDKWRTRDRSAVHVQALFNLVNMHLLANAVLLYHIHYVLNCDSDVSHLALELCLVQGLHLVKMTSGRLVAHRGLDLWGPWSQT